MKAQEAKFSPTDSLKVAIEVASAPEVVSPSEEAKIKKNQIVEPIVEPPKADPPKKRPQLEQLGKQSVSGLSLSSIQYKQKAAQKVNEQSSSQKLRETAINPDKVQEIWEALKQKKKKKGENNTLALMEMDELKFIPPNQLSIQMPNDLNKTELSRAFEEFLPYFRNQLNNDLLEVDIMVSAQIEKEHIFTLEEKLKRLQELNPAIIELQKALDLKI